MDPLTAFSLAASVVQFVAFAGGLLKKTIEIHGSASGLPNTLDVDEVYQELTGLSSSLRGLPDAEDDSNKVDDRIRKDIQSIKALARTCESDCEALLKIVGKIKVEDGPARRLKSLRAAFMALRKDGEIKHLQKRLAEAERQIMLYLGHISNHCHSRHSQALQNLQQRADALALEQKEKFNSLQSSLEQIKLAVTTFEQHKMGNQRIPQVAEIENICKLFAKIALSEQTMVREQVLKSLVYKQYSDRYQSIDPAHTKTFSWVFNSTNTADEGNRIFQWLRKGEGVFWLTGKPGSGKSSMMKFLCDAPQTKTALEEWACGERLAIVSHYFWLSGTKIQKSQEGLWRSLLYGIFQQCPELIEKVCPARWAASGREDRVENQQPHWTLSELLAAVSALPKVSPLGSKFCIFIDGLDEYQGDHLEMCQTIQTLGTTTPDIKLCVSSRPWNDFEDAFGGGPHFIEMHLLTADDIRGYADARLSQHVAWATVSASSSLAVRLVDLILHQAEGVFLWVVLVINQLREGLSNYDSLEDLYRRVQGYPSDLGEFFMQILDSVDPFYHAKMSTSLQICLAAPEPLELSIYYFHEQEHADSKYALNLPLSHPTRKAVEKRHKIIKKRLNGWCKGLIGLQKKSRLEVHFLHRTVRDFLKTSEMEAVLKAKAPVHFSADLSIIKAYTALQKSTALCQPERVEATGDFVPTRYSDAPYKQMIMDVLAAALRIQVKQKHVSDQTLFEAFGHIDEFERSGIEIEDHDQPGSQGKNHTRKLKFADHFLGCIFKSYSVLYLSHRLTNDPGYLELFHIDQYIRSLMRTRNLDSPYTALVRKGLECFLEFQAGLNEKPSVWPEGQSMFAKLILGYRPHNLHWATPLADELEVHGKQLDKESAWRRRAIQLRLASLFLRFGANPNAPLDRSGCTPIRIMIATPLFVKSDTYDDDTYLEELDCLFEHQADSEMKFAAQGQDGDEDDCSDADGELFHASTSAREWFFKELQQPLGENLNKEVIGQVALRLLRRIKKKAEAEAAWRTLENALPRRIYEGIQR